jgi:hypothetical protein
MSVAEHIQALILHMMIVCMIFLVWCLTKTRFIWTVLVMCMAAVSPPPVSLGISAVYAVVMGINILCDGEYDYSDDEE